MTCSVSQPDTELEWIQVIYILGKAKFFKTNFKQEPITWSHQLPY